LAERDQALRYSCRWAYADPPGEPCHDCTALSPPAPAPGPDPSDRCAVCTFSGPSCAGCANEGSPTSRAPAPTKAEAERDRALALLQRARRLWRDRTPSVLAADIDAALTTRPPAPSGAETTFAILRWTCELCPWYVSFCTGDNCPHHTAWKPTLAQPVAAVIHAPAPGPEPKCQCEARMRVGLDLPCAVCEDESMRAMEADVPAPAPVRETCERVPPCWHGEGYQPAPAPGPEPVKEPVKRSQCEACAISLNGEPCAACGEDAWRNGDCPYYQCVALAPARKPETP
jgi:hypothetical protein